MPTRHPRRTRRIRGRREGSVRLETVNGYYDIIGRVAYNQRLSQKRAESVKDYLVAKGVQGKRLIAVGKGESDPIVNCRDTKRAELIKCLEPNRRVEVEQITVEWSH